VSPMIVPPVLFSVVRLTGKYEVRGTFRITVLRTIRVAHLRDKR
jgi:hypothetical protein